ncbi:MULTISPECIES: ABC transporter permease [Actinoalloteichus]|uniref:ABC-type nitrate/sulfonate/bicarbonate transport system, permease component n=1 Tax=Actinoalloteichus fjordicus TaxID=1612552 RepID=A0AAC9LI81_9PSEU|nr:MULTISPECIES: ABC transporter permease [Actinoalloteichus]APU16814.1 ABC-type nitrate/sulfonate/bicarbonate transport system, permease component [Actinoalloteichus fjordicus]APU22879.1 ABC-type nitrate/sulfonate/bicarbonate transport system, permease component [Actinoalloteichus sp. GBA129-24]
MTAVRQRIAAPQRRARVRRPGPPVKRSPARRVAVGLGYLAVVLLLWQLYVTVADVPAYLLPGPTAVLASIGGLMTSGELWPHLFYTLRNIVIGLAAGVVIGSLLGWLLSSFRTVRMVLAPYVVILQAAPKIALAPLLVLWFGLGLGSQLTLIVLLAFFPMMIAMMLGLGEVTDEQRALGRVLDLGPGRFFTVIQLPTALPALFSGARIAVVDAMTGAFLAEYISAQQGLGFLMVQGRSTYDTPQLLAAVVLTVIVGLTGFALVAAWEKRALPWR